jgi:alpha-L-fucosidase
MQDYWYQASQDPTGSFRFLTTPQTFCIVAFNKPTNGSVVVNAGGVVLPIQQGDAIRLLGPNSPAAFSDDGGLEWRMEEDGVLTIDVPEDQVDQVDYAWAFQVSYALF